MANNKPAATLDLDEEVPKTLDLDEQAGGATEEPTEKNLPGSTPALRAAVKSGVAKMQPPTQFEKDRPQLPENYGFTVGNVLKNAAEGAGGLIKSGAEAVKDFAPLGLGLEKDPLGRSAELAHKYVIDPAKQEFMKAQAEPSTAAAAGHYAAGAIPLIGPWAASLGEQAGTGDVGGAAGQAAGTVAAGELLPKLPAVADKIVRGTPITEAGKLEAAVKQAQVVKKPGMNEIEYAQRVQDAIPDLQRIAADNPELAKKGTPRAAVRAFNNRISQIEAPISEHIKQFNAPEDLIHSDQYGREIENAIDQEFAKEPGLYKPGEIEKAKKAVMEYMGDQPKSPLEIENNRRRLNQDSEAYYHADEAGKRAIDVSDATARAQRAAANRIRDLEYGTEDKPGILEKLGVTAQDTNGNPIDLRKVRQQVGNLIELRNHFEDAIVKAEATGDWKPYQKLFTGPSIAAGGLGMIGGAAAGGPVGAVLGTLAGEGAKAWGDYLRSQNPNLNVTKMFRNLAGTTPRPTTEIRAMTPVHQYEHAIGPRIPQHLEPIGPQPAPGAFELGNEQPKNNPAMWEPQVGQNPNLTWGGPRAPFNPPIGPKPAVEPMTPPIVGQQASLLTEAPNTPMPKPPPGKPIPKGAQGELFGIMHPQGGIIPEIGGPGREGTIAPKTGGGAALKPGEKTSDRYFNKETNEWAPERQAIADRAAEKELAGKTPPTDRKPRAYITAGGTAAGKTTMTREVIGKDSNLVNVDSDKNKLEIPEYKQLQAEDPKGAAARVHDESKAISRNMINKAVEKGLDFIYDTSTGGGGEKLFDKLKGLGYDVHLLYADVPTDEAVRRSEKRARESTDPINKGRFVPEEVVRKKHQEAAAAFHNFINSPSIDTVRAFDTTNPKPVEFYNRTGGGEGKVLNQELFDRTKEKAGQGAPAEVAPAEKTEKPPEGFKLSEPHDSEEGKGWKEFYATMPATSKGKTFPRSAGHILVSPEGKNLAVRLVESLEPRRGVGTAMYRAMIDYARKNGYDALISDPEGGTAPEAASIWRKLGAEETKGKGGKSSFRLATAQEPTGSFYGEAGDTVDGLKVRSHVPNTSSIPSTLTDYDEMPGIREVPISAFETGPTKRPTTEVRNLAGHIKQSGELNPLIVVVDKDGPYVLEGGHRYDALGVLGKKSFPAKVVIDRTEKTGIPRGENEVGTAKAETKK